jgi:hypothetical protein
MEDATSGASLGVTDDHHSSRQIAKADDTSLAVVSTTVLYLQRWSFENVRSIREIEAALGQRGAPLIRIEGNAHWLLQLQQPPPRNLAAGIALAVQPSA